MVDEQNNHRRNLGFDRFSSAEIPCPSQLSHNIQKFSNMAQQSVKAIKAEDIGATFKSDSIGMGVLKHADILTLTTTAS